MRLRTALFGLFLSAAPLTFGQQNRWEADIRRYEESDAKNPPAKGGTVFVGSSSIAMWGPTLRTDFPNHNVIGRGFGGSDISDSVYFADRIVTKYQPKLVVLFAGTNDLAGGKSPETVLADYVSFVRRVKARVKGVRIAFISVSPAPSRWNNIESIKRANALVEGFTASDPNLAFVDVYSKMLDAYGLPREELFLADRLHMNRKGYEIWIEAVRPLLPS